MEIVTLFTDQRWNILQQLSMKGLSPLQLAEKSNTTIANISQQLKLLEAAELVKKTKIRNRDKGKPRTIFSLANDYAYIISSMQNFAHKKLIALNEQQKTFLRLMYIEDTKSQYTLLKLFLELDSFITNLDVAVLLNKDGKQTLVLSSAKNADLTKKIKACKSSKELDELGTGIEVVDSADWNKKINQIRKGIENDTLSICILMDPKNMIGILKKGVMA